LAVEVYQPKLGDGLLHNPVRFVDLFCGIGGFHTAAKIAGQERDVTVQCVFASDIDTDAQKVYEANYALRPAGDITQIEAHSVPDHDILFAGFPCQAFSICGDRRGFEDARGTLFFDIARILEEKRPAAFVLENVKQLRGHDGGRTLKVILQTLEELGYQVDWRILNALDFGLPQKRERILIVGFRQHHRFVWPTGGIPMKPLSELLERDEDIPTFYWASEKIRQARIERRAGKKVWEEPTIWHENKGGNISAYPFSCAMRAGASYNYLLVNGERRMTEREMLRLQGFPEDFKIVCSYGATRKQVGNSVAVPCVAAVIGAVLEALQRGEYLYCSVPLWHIVQKQMSL
jgi:DNA (cytosine-5)-methyltransferase 1